MQTTATESMDMRVDGVAPVKLRVDRLMPMKLGVGGEKPTALRMDSPEKRIHFGLSAGRYTEYPIYDGETVVTPNLDTQTLETNRHVMMDDVTVLPIPYQATSNPAGGYTAIIGG